MQNANVLYVFTIHGIKIRIDFRGISGIIPIWTCRIRCCCYISISHTSLLWTCWGLNIAFVWQFLDVGIACRTILPELRLWFCTRSIIPMMWCFTFYKSRGLNAFGWHLERQQKHHRLMMVLDIWSSYTVTVTLPWSLTCLYLQITGDSALYLSAWILNEVWLLTGQAVLG